MPAQNVQFRRSPMAAYTIFEAIINRQLIASNTQNQRCRFAGGANDSCFMEACILFAGNPGYFCQTACLK